MGGIVTYDQNGSNRIGKGDRVSTMNRTDQGEDLTVTSDQERTPGGQLSAVPLEGAEPENAFGHVSEAVEISTGTDDPGGRPATRQENQATRFLRLCNGFDLFHNGKYSFARVPLDDHYEVLRIRSSGFSGYLQRLAYKDDGMVLSGQALNEVLGTLEAHARFDGEERPVYRRVGEKDGVIFIDLGDPTWRAVGITERCWRITDTPWVMFERPPGMQPLPTPTNNGTIDDLRPFVNVETETAFHLVVAWLMGALRPTGPYPILNLSGEQGTGKSGLTRILRSLVDPNIATARTLPRNEEDLLIAAQNSWVLSFDNVSYLKPSFSDALCRLATGGALSKRQLYSDDGETILEAQRPVLLNGIEEIVTQPDLLQRTLLVPLEAILPSERRSELELRAAFDAVKPGIFGALLDGVSTALQNLPTTRLDDPPRMADFALWITAAEPGLGWEQGTVMRAYKNVEWEATQRTLEASPIAVHLFSVMPPGEKWTGTASQLLNKMEEKMPERKPRPNGWPRNAQKLSSMLSRLQPALRERGLEIERIHTRQARLLRLTRAPVQLEIAA